MQASPSTMRSPWIPVVTGIVYGLLGLALAAGGVWLVALGGSFYYVIAGIGLAVSGALLIRRLRAALWVYAALLIGTLAWAIWEVGFDWWPLAARGDVLFPLALWLLCPLVTRNLTDAPPSAWRATTGPLWVGVAASVVVLAIGLFSTYHEIDGKLDVADALVVEILDLDLHYGNGTAALAATRPYLTVLAVYGNDYHANVAYRDVTVRRHEDGLNHWSVALQAGCDGRCLNEILDQHLPRLVQFGKPDLLLYQAGADPLQDDPYSPLALTHHDLLVRDRIVFEFARRHSLPTAWVLAGGYTRDTAKVVEVHLNTFRAAAVVFGGDG